MHTVHFSILSVDGDLVLPFWDFSLTARTKWTLETSRYIWPEGYVSMLMVYTRVAAWRK